MKKQKTCPSCKTAVDENSDYCSHCGWQFDNSKTEHSLSIVRPAARPKIQCCVNLGFTVDRTGSSQAFKTGIPLTVEYILNPVAKKARQTRVWLASHGDLDYGEKPIMHTDGGSPEQAIEDVKLIRFEGGGDASESHLDGIESLMNTVPWTADPTKARGSLVGLINADTKPARSGKTAKQLGEEIRQKNLLLYLVCEPTKTLEELVTSASGMMFQISNNPDPHELQKIADQLAASIIATVSAGSTVPMTVPADSIFNGK